MPVRSGVARFKMVISATRHGVQLHQSLDSLPGERRKAAREALEGDLSATLLIADRAGLSRMHRLLKQTGEGSAKSGSNIGVARQIALGFAGAGGIMLAALIWIWLR